MLGKIFFHHGSKGDRRLLASVNPEALPNNPEPLALKQAPYAIIPGLTLEGLYALL